MALKETIKSLFEKALTLGTPPDQKALLYSEVIKKEKQEVKEALKLEKEKAKRIREQAKIAKEKAKQAKEAAKVQKILEKKSATKKKKSSTKKTTAKKEISKKITKDPVKKSTTTNKKTKSESTPKKKTAPKKETSKSTTEKIPSTKKNASKKTIKTPAKTKETKSKTIKKSTVKKVSKRDEKIALYIKDIKKHYGEVDEDFVAIVVKNLGPSIYRKDAELVSCSDPKELDTVRRNFLMKKLQIDASQAVLDAAIKDVCEELKGVRNKYRATFYYSLAKKFKKESVLN